MELVPVDILKERYTEYLDLIESNPHRLAERIFCGEEKCVNRVVAIFD